MVARLVDGCNVRMVRSPTVLPRTDRTATSSGQTDARRLRARKKRAGRPILRTAGSRGSHGAGLLARPGTMSRMSTRTPSAHASTRRRDRGKGRATTQCCGLRWLRGARNRAGMGCAGQRSRFGTATSPDAPARSRPPPHRARPRFRTRRSRSRPSPTCARDGRRRSGGARPARRRSPARARSPAPRDRCGRPPRVRQRAAVDAVPACEDGGGGQRDTRIDQQHGRAGEAVARHGVRSSPLPVAARCAREQAGGHVGAESRAMRAAHPRLRSRPQKPQQPQRRRRIGRAAAKPRRDRQPLVEDQLAAVRHAEASASARAARSTRLSPSPASAAANGPVTVEAQPLRPPPRAARSPSSQKAKIVSIR